MNSAEDLPNIINDDDNESNETPDPNANLRDTSRGAIPKKTKPLSSSAKPSKTVSSTSSTSKKTIKLNNNIENMSTLNASTSSEEVSLVPKMNGVTCNGLCLVEPSCSSRQTFCNYELHEGGTSDIDIVGGEPVDNISDVNTGLMLSTNSGETPKVNGVTPNGLCLCHSCPSRRTYCVFEMSEATTESDSEVDSDADTELLSVSEDGCIYTYKGDHNADLPSSFFDIPPEIPENQQDQPVIEEAVNRQDASSPEMDYLEMDFDPSNNGDGDSASENEMPIEEESVNVNDEAGVILQDVNVCQPSTSTSTSETRVITAENEEILVPNVNTSPLQEIAASVERWVENNTPPLPACDVMIPDEGKVMPWSCTLAQRTKSKHLRFTKRVHCARGELISPCEVPPIACRIVMYRPEFFDEAAMIWSRDEARLKQVTQIGPSACGATAVLNVLNALRFPIPSMEKLRECVTTRLRENDSPLTKYLLSRSRAGSTHTDLINGLHEISNGTIYARFFHMYPERIVNLNKWLGFWINNGAVPIATLNLQKCVGTIPDCWHHQMIYGVDSNGIYLTNPYEHVEANLLWPQLNSESVLLVRRSFVLSRWNVNTDMPDLMRINDVRWQRLNVVGQVANIVHESNRELRQGLTNTPHIRIPADYSSGITLAMSINSPAYALLKQAPELPLLGSQDEEGN